MADEEEFNLKDIFDRGFNLFQKIESDDSPSNSEPFQNNVSQAISYLRKTLEKVDDLSLFSKNEELDDISTNNLRYLLSPALLGDLNLKTCSNKRIDAVKMSKIYFSDFLERCKLYGLASQDIKLEQSCERASMGNPRNLEYLANERQAKITRYKKLKEQEQKIKDLSKVLENSFQPHDEELQRKYNILLLENWVNKALDHISSINSELEILEHMAKRKEQSNNPGNAANHNKTNEKKVLPKPVVITREYIKNQVFGAGYPSLPTMTQEEYFEKELREGKIVTEFRDKLNTKTEGEEEDAESAEDEKYLAKLKKEREWDDWKDNNRRGWGNRENMG